MKIFLTVGQDASGKLHLLYLGESGERAVELLENPPAELGIVKTSYWKRPPEDKRRRFRGAVAVAVADIADVADVATAEGHAEGEGNTPHPGPLPSEGRGEEEAAEGEPSEVLARLVPLYDEPLTDTQVAKLPAVEGPAPLKRKKK